MQEQYELHWKDYYEILRVPRSCDDGEKIKANYRTLMKLTHGDANQGYEHAEDQAKDLNEAYDCLKDAAKRAAYWRYYQQREAPPRQERRAQPPPNDVDDEAFRKQAEDYFRRQAEEAARRAREEQERQRREAEERARREEERKAEEARLAEERRIEEEKRQAEEEKRKAEHKIRAKKARKVFALICAAIVLVSGATIALYPVVSYRIAVNALNAGDLQTAAKCFVAAGNYKDSHEQIQALLPTLQAIAQKAGSLIHSNGARYCVGLKQDGTIAIESTGSDCKPALDALRKWNNIIDIDHNWDYTVGLTLNGTVRLVHNYDGDVSEWVSSWSDIVEVACAYASNYVNDSSSYHVVYVAGLTKDGNVMVCEIEPDSKNKKTYTMWNDIKAIYGGSGGLAGIKKDGKIVTNIKDFAAVSENNIVAVEILMETKIGVQGLRGDGTVIVWGRSGENATTTGAKNIIGFTGMWDFLRADGRLVDSNGKRDLFLGDFIGFFANKNVIAAGYYLYLYADGTLKWNGRQVDKLWSGSCFDPDWLK